MKKIKVKSNIKFSENYEEVFKNQELLLETNCDGAILFKYLDSFNNSPVQLNNILDYFQEKDYKTPNNINFESYISQIIQYLMNIKVVDICES